MSLLTSSSHNRSSQETIKLYIKVKLPQTFSWTGKRLLAVASESLLCRAVLTQLQLSKRIIRIKSLVDRLPSSFIPTELMKNSLLHFSRNLLGHEMICEGEHKQYSHTPKPTYRILHHYGLYCWYTHTDYGYYFTVICAYAEVLKRFACKQF